MNPELQDALDRHLEWTPNREISKEEATLYFLSLALAGEAGELANKAKKMWRDGDFTQLEGFKKELSDVGNYAFMIAKRLRYDLEKGMLDKMLEVEQRPAWKERHK